MPCPAELAPAPFAVMLAYPRSPALLTDVLQDGDGENTAAPLDLLHYEQADL